PVIPSYISSVIENATPSLLTLTYNLTLANIVPAASAFTVLVNNVARTVTGISVSGTKVQLTLSSPVVYGDVVTVAYTKPASNPLQTSTGGQAASITAQPVTNNVSSVIPVYVSSVIENATPSLLTLTYNLTLANIVPAASAFTVLVNNVARTVTGISVSGTKVQLTLESPVVYGDVVTVAYTKPASNPLQTSTGDQAASITAQSVTNNIVSETLYEVQMNIYPNPAQDILNISIQYPNNSSIEEIPNSSSIIRFIDLSGKVVSEKSLDPGVKEIQIPINLRSGIYIVQMISDGLTVATNKLIVAH
ncbi:MAG: T9SS type A sorting domain-containing protein, partial [Bacteroidales bacterium]|nr:T9SS type A sorting domain-containing protein [Bacteroidales bacterium]